MLLIVSRLVSFK